MAPSTAARCLSASTFLLNVLERLSPSGVRHRARQPVATYGRLAQGRRTRWPASTVPPAPPTGLLKATREALVRYCRSELGRAGQPATPTCPALDGPRLVLAGRGGVGQENGPAEVTRSASELEEAASHVTGEWALLAETSSLLPQTGDRSPLERAAMEATLVHARCLINFCCGDAKGKRDARDIPPADFLGADWWPRDEDFDQKLRGRLRFINEELQHLSWQRVVNKAPLLVPIILLVHEVHWAMHLFVAELRAKQSPWHPTFENQEHYVARLLPPLRPTRETVPHLARARPNPAPP